MKRGTSYIVLIFAMVMLTQACASSRSKLSFEPGAIDTDAYVRKVDQFVVITDGSLSMTDRWQGQRKLGVAEDFLMSLNQTVPDLGYDGGLRTFGRGLCKSEGKTVSIIEVGEYLTSSFGDGVARFNCANGTSPLNLALDAAGADLYNRDSRTAIVIVSDGLDMGKKEVPDLPVTALRAEQLGRVMAPPGALRDAAEKIDAAARISLFVGDGARAARESLVALAEHLRAPIIFSLKAKDIVPADHPCTAGGLGLLGSRPGVSAMENCDTLLVLGTDFPYREWFNQDCNVIQVDNRASVIGRRRPGATAFQLGFSL